MLFSEQMPLPSITETAQVLSHVGTLRNVPVTKSGSSSSGEQGRSEPFVNECHTHRVSEHPSPSYSSRAPTARNLEGLQGGESKPGCSPIHPSPQSPPQLGRLFQTSKFKHPLPRKPNPRSDRTPAGPGPHSPTQAPPETAEVVLQRPPATRPHPTASPG